jgi:hypothetical protein
MKINPGNRSMKCRSFMMNEPSPGEGRRSGAGYRQQAGRPTTVPRDAYWLSCENLSISLLRHLQKRAPVSIREAVKRYWPRQPVDDGEGLRHHKLRARQAMTFSVLAYAGLGLFEPVDRHSCGVVKWLKESTSISEKELLLLIDGVPARDFNRILIMHAGDYAGKGYQPLEAVEWKLSDRAKECGQMLQPIKGVMI